TDDRGPSGDRVPDHAGRLSWHGRRWQHRRPGSRRQCGRRRAGAARHRDRRASGHARAPVSSRRRRAGIRHTRGLEQHLLDLELTEKVALVTGATSGVGPAIAHALAAEGATVAVNYRSSGQDAAGLAAEISHNAARAKAYAADVSDFAAVTA